MFTPEQAHEHLVRVAVPDYLARQRSRAHALPGNLRTVADRLRTDLNPYTYAEIAQLLDELADPDRRQVFDSLHPSLGELLSLAWQELQPGPGTSDWAMPFRYPGHPERTRYARGEWLHSVLNQTSPYEQPVTWFATWAGWLPAPHPARVERLGRLLAVAIDHGHDEVLDTLAETVQGSHQVALMGGHVPVALLACARPEAWPLVESLLLDAQREEGLRRGILEAARVAHPRAFARVVRLIVEHGLTRFPAAVDAVGSWLGDYLYPGEPETVDQILVDLLRYLHEPGNRRAAVATQDPRQIYLALWAMAFEDAGSAWRPAVMLLQFPDPSLRLVGARFLVEIQLRPMPLAATAVADPDERLAASMTAVVSALVSGDLAPEHSYDERTVAAWSELMNDTSVYRRVPRGVWTTNWSELSPLDVASALWTVMSRYPQPRLVEAVRSLSSHGRSQALELMAGDPQRHREALLALADDRSANVLRTAVRALADGSPPTDVEARELEKVLRRRDSEVRSQLIALLLRQPDAGARESARRLQTGSALQVAAGEEMLGALRAAGRTRSAGEDRHPGGVAPADLVDHDARTAGELHPVQTELSRWRPGVRLVLTSLDAWFSEHGLDVANLEVKMPSRAVPWDRQRELLPFADLLNPWWQRTGPQLTAGGVELLLAAAAADAAWSPSDGSEDYRRQSSEGPPWGVVFELLTGTRDLHDLPCPGRSLGRGPSLLIWLEARELRPEWIEPLLDAAETVLALVPEAIRADLPQVEASHSSYESRIGFDWRVPRICSWVEHAHLLEALRPELWSAADRARLWRLSRYLDEPAGRYDPRTGGRHEPKLRSWYSKAHTDLPDRPARLRPPVGLAARAVEQRVASPADVMDLLVSERVPEDGPRWHASALGELTSPGAAELLAAHPWLASLVDRVRGLVIDAEINRGDLPTPTTPLVDLLRRVEGSETLIRLVAGLGDLQPVRGPTYGAESKPETLSQLIRICHPAADDTADRFAEAVRGAGLPEQRLLELALYTPRWAPYVAYACGQPGLTEAVYWVLAHTKDTRGWGDAHQREEWIGQVQERTPLTATELEEGAVDVAWFLRIRSTVRERHLDALLKAAKYASESTGHSRARLFAQALRGKLDRSELLGRIETHRNQDALRALGLLPFPADEPARRADLLERYRFLHDFRRQSRRQGRQRQESERVAVRVALANLARNAGYRDPHRMAWALEADALRDLAAGPLVATAGEVTVSLSLDGSGGPALAVRRGDRPLKSVPASHRRDDQIAALKDRAQELRAQSRRMRASLEEAMVRAERFTQDELAELLAHPLLAPRLGTLILISDGGRLGFPREGGRMFEDHTGASLVADGSPVRIAHPHDLLASGDWPQWQRRIFAQRVRQPFKQVFRELYVLTGVERESGDRSLRFAGQQVHGLRAGALLTSSGWVVVRHGHPYRTFHEQRLTAFVTGDYGSFTPPDDGPVALGAVGFRRVDGADPIPLEAVPATLFSETMRDIDLVVSVAHAGRVDPEASMSTVEMRAALVQETTNLLRLPNVEVDGNRARIEGELGTYSVHLGSGVVHLHPGYALCIIPVDAQQRGRLFLPFADDDPKTAEVVSKVVLLARDTKIRDPSILRQLRR